MPNANLWILTEERPKDEVISDIINEFCDKYNFQRQGQKPRIKPIITKEKFEFQYQVVDVTIENVEKIILKVISGAEGSFVDFLVFNQLTEPNENDKPLFVIEETKTNPAESRNVAVYQRTSKFVFVDLFPVNNDSKKIMLYSIRQPYNTLPSTFILGIKAMKTLGVKILNLEEGKEGRNEKFESVDELIKFKNNIAGGPSHNIPLKIEKTKNLHEYRISGKLEKSGTLSHDPNIGAVSLFAKLLHVLDPQTKKITVYNHKLTQKMINNSQNKFVKIANKLNLQLEGLTLSKTTIGDKYWEYNNKGEKIVSIFFHLALQYSKIKIIYENHAGCEQGYFEFPDKRLSSITKKTGKPDVIIINSENKEICLIEAEMDKNAFGENKGVNQLPKFKQVEQEYCSAYEGYSFSRYVILFGDKDIDSTKKDADKIIFQLKTDGTMKFFSSCPQWIKQKIKSI